MKKSYFATPILRVNALLAFARIPGSFTTPRLIKIEWKYPTNVAKGIKPAQKKERLSQEMAGALSHNVDWC